MSEKKYVVLPKTDVHLIPVQSYVEAVPDTDYEQASEKARDEFRDMKFGVRIHWGLYSKWHLQNESWPFLKMSNEDKQKYQELYKEFNPKGFSAEEWMTFFNRVGFKCFAFTTKHHEGFSLFDTKTKVKRRVNWTASNGPQIEECNLSYSVMDSPFKRDVVKELCEAARKHDIKIDLYFSHPDWFDADFRPYAFHPLSVPDYENMLTKDEIYSFEYFFGDRKPIVVNSLTKEDKQRMILRHREQLVELLTNYGKIDMVCLDMWLGVDVWPELKETMKILRKIQPDVMFRARGIGNYGDFYTPEGFVPGNKENTNMPWMVIYPLGKSFSYDPEGSRYKGSEWVIKNLVDTVAKGGNFMVGIGPDEDGRWHPQAIRDLEEVGQWLDINGEAIYGTRERQGFLYKEGENIRFTRTKDSRFIYSICTEWPGKVLNIKTVKPAANSKIYLLGYGEPLLWSYDENEGLKIDMPDYLQDVSNRPCKTAYSFKIETTDWN
jgi:alpha-L-fucosidase